MWWHGWWKNVKKINSQYVEKVVSFLSLSNFLSILTKKVHFGLFSVFKHFEHFAYCFLWNSSIDETVHWLSHHACYKFDLPANAILLTLIKVRSSLSVFFRCRVISRENGFCLYEETSWGRKMFIFWVDLCWILPKGLDLELYTSFRAKNMLKLIISCMVNSLSVLELSFV